MSQSIANAAGRPGIASQAGIPDLRPKHASPATTNRYPAMIRAVLRRTALAWEWIDKAPLIRLNPESKRPVRWLHPEQVSRLRQELPAHLIDIVGFSLATGLRRRNVVDLEGDGEAVRSPGPEQFGQHATVQSTHNGRRNTVPV